MFKVATYHTSSYYLKTCSENGLEFSFIANKGEPIGPFFTSFALKTVVTETGQGPRNYNGTTAYF